MTEVENFSLASDVRAAKRQAFDNSVQQKQREYEEAQRKLEAEKLEREKAEVARLRQALTFKAQPVKKYKPVQVKPSSIT